MTEGYKVKKIYLGNQLVWPDEWPDIDKYTLTISKTLNPPSDNWHALCCSRDGKYLYTWVANAWLYWYYLSDWSINTLPSSPTYSKTWTWTATRAMYITSDGKKLYSWTDGSWVYMFTMWTAYNLSNSSVSWSFINGRRTWFEFSPDWKYCYTWQRYTSWNPIYQYQCSTPFDLSTASLLRSFNTYTSSWSYDVRFSDTWLKMFVWDRWDSWNIYQFNLTTPRDISTASLYKTRSFGGYVSGESWVTFDFAKWWHRMFMLSVIGTRLWQCDA